MRVVFDSNGTAAGGQPELAALVGCRRAAAGVDAVRRTAASIPGLIEAENFDEGGGGVAYHDSSPGNSGGQYRQTDVDVASTIDSPGGYALGYVAAGEWLKYSVSVASGGSYTLDARVASPGAGGTFHVEIDGVDATGPLAVPSSGGWDIYRTLTVNNIALTVGPRVLRVVFDTNGVTGFWGNLNYLRWSAATTATTEVQGSRF